MHNMAIHERRILNTLQKYEIVGKKSEMKMGHAVNFITNNKNRVQQHNRLP